MSQIRILAKSSKLKTVVMKYQYVSLHSLRNKHQNRCRCESDVLRIMPTGGIGKAPVETGQTLSVQFRSDPSEERGKIGGLGKEILSLQQSSGLKRTSGNFWSQNHSRKVLHLVGTGLFLVSRAHSVTGPMGKWGFHTHSDSFRAQQLEPSVKYGPCAGDGSGSFSWLPHHIFHMWVISSGDLLSGRHTSSDYNLQALLRAKTVN